MCHAVRAPAAKVTEPPVERAGSAASNSRTTRADPVKFSADPCWLGCEPARKMLICCAVKPLASARAVKGTDATADAIEVAHAYRLSGDIKRGLGDLSGARAAWSAALAAMPNTSNERPAEMREHATILQRVGRRAQADPLSTKLRAMGFQRLG